MSIALVHATTTPMVIRANRVVVEGTVAGTTTTWPGPIVRVTIDLKAGGSKTYILNLAGGIPVPGEGAVVKYGLNFDAALYVPIGYAALSPFGVCTSYVINGDGDKNATFDVKGVPITYIVTETFQDHATTNDYLDLTIDTGTGTVTAHALITVGLTAYEVVSLDLVNGTMTLLNSATYYFVDDTTVVVYDEDQTYIGLAGLSVGDDVYWNGTDPVFELVP